VTLDTKIFTVVFGGSNWLCTIITCLWYHCQI